MDLFWPGDQRAGDLMGDAALLRAMVEVEAAWLEALVEAGLAPASALPDGPLMDLASSADVHVLALGAEAGGNPVIGLVALLRQRLSSVRPEAARWLHRGLTSQDVLDTALVLLARTALARVATDLESQRERLCDLVEAHRRTPMVARTLTQHAVPTTFGLVAASWLLGVLEAADGLAGLRFPAQFGGAGGTVAATVELAASRPDPAAAVLAVLGATRERLDLDRLPPWHATRATITRLGDAAVGCTDAWGHLANDVLTLSRPELGELSEGTPGGSSTMPGKANPVLSSLVRRAALTTPHLAATLHLAAAESGDQRSAGPWHAEWATLRTLLRRTVVAAAQTTELLDGLVVHADRMAATLAAAPTVLAEQHAMADLAGHAHRDDPATYLGASDLLIDAVLDEAAQRQKGVGP